MTGLWWHGFAVGVPLLGIGAYLILSDTLDAIHRHAVDPSKPLPLMAFARLSFCALACSLIVPLADLFSAFNLPWYWLAGLAVLIGFKAGQWWEILKQVGRVTDEESR